MKEARIEIKIYLPESGDPLPCLVYNDSALKIVYTKNGNLDVFLNDQMTGLATIQAVRRILHLPISIGSGLCCTQDVEPVKAFEP